MDLARSSDGKTSANNSHSQRKQDRKRQLRVYLSQLKQIVERGSADDTSESDSLIETDSQNRHVLNELKRLWQVNFGESEESDGASISSDSQPENELRLLVKSNDFRIKKVSSNIKNILGYPKGSFEGRDLMTFVHKNDITVISFITIPDDKDIHDRYPNLDDNWDIENAKKIIYFRLRLYKSLSDGFSVDYQQHYIPFQAVVSLFVPTNSACSMVNEQKYLMFRCLPLASLSKEWLREPAEDRTFSTRHNHLCLFTYTNSNVVAVLGFLPQDMVGLPIFEFYHPEDFDHLYDIYKQVINTVNGTSVGSPCIRILAKNGEWVATQSEWSSFVNPWTKKLEFVVSHHTVIQGPQNRDVWSSRGPKRHPLLDNNRLNNTVEMFRALLVQPVETPENSDSNTNSSSNNSDTSDQQEGS